MKCIPAVLTLLLAACAAPQEVPSQYERGAPGARPLPARPQPRVGPTYAPGSPGIQVEPGPKRTRILPETPETMRQPGLWATKEPETTGAIRLFGLSIATPAEHDERALTAWCADQARVRFAEASYIKRDPTWLSCFANVIIQACLDSEKTNMENRVRTNTAGQIHRDRLRNITPAAEFSAKERKRVCDTIDAETNKAYYDMWAFVSKIVWGGQ